MQNGSCEASPLPHVWYLNTLFSRWIGQRSCSPDREGGAERGGCCSPVCSSPQILSGRVLMKAVGMRGVS